MVAKTIVKLCRKKNISGMALEEPAMLFRIIKKLFFSW